MGELDHLPESVRGYRVEEKQREIADRILIKNKFRSGAWTSLKSALEYRYKCGDIQECKHILGKMVYVAEHDRKI